MHFHILTLFPDLVTPYFQGSILGKAIEANRIQLSVHQLRDYAKNTQRSVDDRPYGGGAGMVFRPEVVVDAVEDLKQKYSIQKVCLTSPKGKVFSSQLAQQQAQLESLLIICGRYEGFDQRVVDILQPEEWSLGDFVLNGGEVAAMAIMETLIRLTPGVLGDGPDIPDPRRLPASSSEGAQADEASEDLESSLHGTPFGDGLRGARAW